MSAIDDEIRRLEQARKILAGTRPSGRQAIAARHGSRKRGRLSAAGRTRIAAAQRKRGAEQRNTKKQAASKA